MKKYKRYIKLFFAFIGLFIFIFLCIDLLSKGYTNKYTLKDNKYEVKEIYTKDEQQEHDNYYIEIKVNNLVYNYQIYKEIKDNNKVVKDVLFYDGDYKCLLPILSDDIKVDFVCYKDNKYYNYHDLVDKDEQLDNYIKSLDKKLYNVKDFDDDKSNEESANKIYYYKNNIPSNIILSISTLKGLGIIGDEVEFIELLSKETYKREISTYADHYYISANYNSSQDFREFYVVDILTGKEKIIKAPDYISFDSYIQGVVDHSVYIYDIDNEKQYKINLEESLITEVGNANKGIRYYDGEWNYISAIKANRKVTFIQKNDKKFNKCKYVYKYGNKLSGFYYLYYETDKGYDVYRASVQNTNIKKYLFTVDDYNDVVYVEDYLLYKDGDSIKIYSDYSGIKTVLKYSELKFNHNILFYGHVEK